MKVSISVPGRFHAFNLAQQLHSRGHLSQLITSYPKSEVARYGIPPEKTSSIIFKELIERGYSKLPAPVKRKFNPKRFLHETFDRCASHKYLSSDICLAFAGLGLHTIRKAKSSGAVTIIERGSSHIKYQMALLRKEYDKFGLKPHFYKPYLVEKEVQEYKEADYISVPSSFVKKTFLDQGIPENKIIHVPYGVELKDFRPEQKTDDTFRIIYCGSITLRKGVHYLLQAFTELNLPNAELWLIGKIDAEMVPFIEKYKKDNILFKGPFKQVDLHKYYSQGSVFTIMSLEEGLAMVLPQAMSCGLPVVCTTNTGGEDIIRNGKEGFIIPIRDTEALKEKILYFYDNPDVCKAMGQAARERVSNSFTWEDYGIEIVTAYKRCLSRR